MLLDLRPAEDLSSIECVRLACSTVPEAPRQCKTMVLWLICGFTFGHYLAEFAYTYVNYYAGLASAMIALVFLY
jgi:hypothetical protein